ncbi:MAG: ATP-binding protein, partial [Syntrophobacteraceae bacterium]
GKNEFFALIESIFMEDAHGRKQCRISVTDISGRKRAEKITRLYMEKLEQSNRQLQEFAFIASHDLQEPLRKIQTFGAQLKRKHSQALDQNGHDYLNRMVNAAKRMSEMIRGLLDFSRVGTETCRFGTVDLSGIIREVKDDLEILIKQSGAFIQVGRLPSIEADSNQMRRLFQNLVINAIKFHGEEKPSIKIYTVLDESGSHRIFVEDNGIGFDEQYAERIFILFQRLHGRSTHDGTGMGLAICRKIVELHHGSITARSKPGQGSTFIITLPEKQPIES